jgi:hypothetical protein
MFLVVFLLVLSAVGFFGTKYYSFIFARTVDGPIEEVERVTQPTAILGGGPGLAPNQIYSFAVSIRDTKTGEIVTSSSEDRQWAVAHKGQCAKAKFFPYVPWDFEKAGTYFGARLLHLHDCPSP